MALHEHPGIVAESVALSERQIRFSGSYCFSRFLPSSPHARLRYVAYLCRHVAYRLGSLFSCSWEWIEQDSPFLVTPGFLSRFQVSIALSKFSTIHARLAL